MKYAGRLFCTVYRPRFIDSRRLQDLAIESRLVMSALERVEKTILDRPVELLPHLGTFSDQERALMSLPRRLRRTDVSIRLDAAALGTDWRFFELNGSIPGGIEFMHKCAELFQKTPVFQSVSSRFDIRGFDLRRQTLLSIVGTWKAFGGSGTPRVAIVDWLDTAPLIEEFRMLSRWLANEGIEARLVDPRELQYQAG